LEDTAPQKFRKLHIWSQHDACPEIYLSSLCFCLSCVAARRLLGDLSVFLYRSRT